MNLSERLVGCFKEFQGRQVSELLSYFNAVNPLLIGRSAVGTNSINDVKSALDSLRAFCNGGNDLLRASLQKNLAELEKEYQSRLKLLENADRSNTLELSLLLNSNEGNKELLLPIKWENVRNRQKDSGNLAEKIYDAALQIMLSADMACDEKSSNFAGDIKGYIKIVSNGVSEKPEMNQLSANDIRDRINAKLGNELKQANITLNVVCGNIRMNGYVPLEKTESPASPVKRRKYFSGDLSEAVNNFVCVTVPEAAEYLGINPLGALNKVKNGHLHGLQRAENSHIHIPMHDLITYTFNHPRLKQEKPVGSHAFSMSMVELDDEQLAKYKSEVGEVKTVIESADILGLSKATVHSMLDRSQLHGVKHRNQWYIPKMELEFVKYLRTSKEEQK